ncbi:MAG: hypothetical protein RIS35_1508, partial [Pseudomonadota bacterium]
MNTPTTPLVIADSLSKVFDVSPPWLERIVERKPRQLLHAVDGVSFSIARGETLALVGESGCGKSTLARMLVGLYRPTTGQIRFDGVDLDADGVTRLRGRLQMIFQDPYASLNPRWRVADVIAEPLRVHRRAKGPREVDARVDELLALVGLNP